MEIIRMENFINRNRKSFRAIVRGMQNGSIKGDTLKIFLSEALEHCCSQFEEDTLIENLAEEYKLYLKELAAA